VSTHSIKQQLLKLFGKSKKDRHRFLANHLSANIAAQIFSLRTAEDRNWTQTQLAKEAGIAQPRIPVYESPDYGVFSLTTLKKLAYAFDGALIVKFVSFDELASEIANQSSENLAVAKFEDMLIPQQAQAVKQNFNPMAADSTVDTSEGVLLGQHKSIGRSDIYEATMNSGQRSSAFSACQINTMNEEKNQEKQLAGRI
jgi:transcriptional regulator with XRE-family HTH domain